MISKDKEKLNKLDVNKQALLELIRKSQFESTGTSYDYSDVDWDTVYKEALDQTVLGLVASEVPKDVMLSDERWKIAQYNQVSSYLKYEYAEKELINILENADISYVIIKGNAAACYYNNPEKRKMGDIDFLVPPDYFTKTRNELVSQGYIITQDTDVNPRHIGLVKYGVLVELHRFFSYKGLDVEEYINTGFNERMVCNIQDHHFMMLPKIANGLVLIVHLRQHLRGGLGLRQLVDWMMFVYKELDDDFYNKYFKKVLVDKGLERLAVVATRVCQMYLGLSDSIEWCKQADEALCFEFLDILFRSGNFGIKKQNDGAVEGVTRNIKKNGLFKSLQSSGEANWTLYHKHHWLKPFCWIYQMFRYLFKGIKTGKSSKQMAEDMAYGKKWAEVLKELGI